MDLLLHLVQQRELPIEQVNLVEVCRQYLEIVLGSRFLDLERASEYLVIAATLTAIKSEALVSGRGGNIEGEIDESFDPAFFASLRERLREYQLTKLRAQTLAHRPQLAITTFSRPTRSITIERPKTGDEDIVYGDVSELGRLFAALLKRVGAKVGSYRISAESVSVVSCMMKFVDLLRRKSGDGVPRAHHTFRSMLAGIFQRSTNLAEPAAHMQRRSTVIGGFIALLEMMKRGLVSAEQGEYGGEIDVTVRFADGVESLSPLDLTTEFDKESDSVERPNFRSSEDILVESRRASGG